MHTLEDIYQFLQSGAVVITNFVTVTNYVPISSTNALVEKTGQVTEYSPGDDGDYQKGVAWPVPRFARQWRWNCNR